ncbi:MAG: SDR family NAD(P)-dependent oxidoreductase [Bacteroidota bacterium]
MNPPAESLKPYALITGASMGIGKALATYCAQIGKSVLLVALPGPELEAAQQQLQQDYPQISVFALGVDLCKAKGPEKVWNWIRKNGFVVDWLINNAGVGAGGRFEYLELEKYHAIQQLNNQAMVSLTHYLLPMLKAQPAGRLLNMSSLEATLPLPYKAVYTGSKMFVYGFSLALREELRVANSPLKVSVLCPGPVVTNEEGLRRIDSHGTRAKLIMMFPEQVAEIAIPAMQKGKAVIVPGKVNQFIVVFMGILPRFLRMRILERIFRVYRDHNG